ncbi:MAG: hypothetical protein JJE17_01715 [Peptostreptococcaceae bacterium]|nr:hypothetical protein [Peptostreptococcaceae bacterium]
MRNTEIKAIMKESRFFNYEIAESLRVSEARFSQWFRKELSPEQKEKIVSTINRLKLD